MKAPPRVVHFFSSASGYRWFLDQVLTIVALGVDVECIIGAEGWLTEELRRNGIKVYIFDLSLPWRIEELGVTAARLKRFVDLVRFLVEKNYDAAHFHLFESAAIGRLASWVAGIPVRIRMNETPATLDGKTARRIELAMRKFDTHTVASSELIRSQYLQAGIKPAEVSVIYYGANIRTLSPGIITQHAARQALFQRFGIPTSGPLVGMVAHFYAQLHNSNFAAERYWGQPVKLHRLFISAAQEVLKTRPDAVFVLAGGAFRETDRLYFEEMKQAVNDRGLSEHVFFTGMISNIQELLAALDLSVQCSTFDNLGGVLESMAMGCPTIATNVGAFSEAIEDGITGSLVRADEQELCEQILRLLNAPQSAVDMGERGLNLVRQKFSAEQSATKLAALYRAKSSKKHSKPGSFEVCIRTISVLPLFIWMASLLADRDLASKLAQFNWHGIKRLLSRLNKSLCDRVLSALVLTVLAPLIILVIIGSSFRRHQSIYRYKICGQNRKSFLLYTWCPMQLLNNGTLAPEQTAEGFGLDLLAPPQPRLRQRLWWLPSLFNVLRGELALVGPCLREAGFESHGQSWHLSKPGLTGWTQLRKCKESQEAELNDSLYAVTQSPLLDCKIILRRIFHSTKRQKLERTVTIIARAVQPDSNVSV